MWFAIGAAVAVMAGAATVAIQVDDWGRDLTTNVAETARAATDPDLRPLTVALAPPATADLVASVGGALPRWTLAARRSTDSTIVLDFIRATRIFRFRDDVTVTVTGRGDHSVVTARSASRIGTGDLGQNPRNLKELGRALRVHLEDLAVGGPR